MKIFLDLHMKFISALIVFVCIISTCASAQDTRTFDSAKVLDFITKNELIQAERLINQASPRDKQLSSWFYSKGRLSFAQEQFSDAIEAFEKAVSMESTNIDYLLGLGNANCAEAQRANVLRSPFLARTCKSTYEKVLEIEPENTRALNNLVAFHIEAPGIVGGSYSEAEKLSDKLMGIDPFQGYMSKFNIELGRKDTLKALDVLQAGGTALPDSIAFPLNRGLLLGENRQFDESYIYLNRALALDTDNPMIHFYLGRLSTISSKNLDEGMNSLMFVLNSDTGKIPDVVHSMTYVYLGRIHVLKGNKAAAKEAFEQALKVRFDNKIAGEELKKL